MNSNVFICMKAADNAYGHALGCICTGCGFHAVGEQPVSNSPVNLLLKLVGIDIARILFDFIQLSERCASRLTLGDLRDRLQDLRIICANVDVVSSEVVNILQARLGQSKIRCSHSRARGRSCLPDPWP
jgi:hypothetical protein